MKQETIQSKQNIKHRYEVLIEKKSETKFIASVLGWHNCKIEGTTKDEALQKLHQLLTNQLQNFGHRSCFSFSTKSPISYKTN